MLAMFDTDDLKFISVSCENSNLLSFFFFCRVIHDDGHSQFYLSVPWGLAWQNGVKGHGSVIVERTCNGNGTDPQR